MDFNYIKWYWLRTVLLFCLTCIVLVDNALAGNYQSSVALPVIHSKGYLYTADLPVSRHAPSAATVSNVSWNWSVVGWPQGLEVYICHASGACLDISRQRVGSTARFSKVLASRKFYYALRVGNAGRVPLAGQLGHITVNGGVTGSLPARREGVLNYQLVMSRNF